MPSYWRRRVHVEMDGLCWIDLFWTSLIYGWGMICGFQHFWELAFCTKFLPSINDGWDVFVQNNVCWKLVFGELRNLMWRWWRWLLPFVWQFGMSFIVFACACSTTNSKPFNLVLFQQLCGREVLWNWFYIFAACERLESMFVENVMFIFQQQLTWRSYGSEKLRFLWPK